MIYGIAKLIDDSGRIVLPKDLRNKLNIASGTNIILYENDGKIIIEVVTLKCKICGSTENIKEDLPLCRECIEKAKQY